MRGVAPRARMTISAGTSKDFPNVKRDEYCVLGRSNVGKSSFINHAFNDRTLARVSKTPGKTTLANFYQLSSGECWVDLPGYGYAKGAKGQTHRLSDLVRDYCSIREQLKGIMWLIDVRHPGLETDAQAGQWLRELGKPFLVVLTKCDKESNSRLAVLVKQHREVFAPGTTFVKYSTSVPRSRDDFWTAYSQWVAGIGEAGSA